MAEATRRRAVFLDRDGTLNVDNGYVSRPEDVRLMPRAAEGAKALADAGYALVIVSNQSGIARGMMTPAQADAVDERLRELLSQHGVRIEATYRCPHLPGGKVAQYAIDCDCRKPKAGMIFQAARDLRLDLERSWTIGNEPRDIRAGLAAGTRVVRISADARTRGDGPKVWHARDLLQAARVINKG